MIKKGANKPYICLAALVLFGNGAFTVNFSFKSGVDLISAVLNLILTAVTLCFTMKIAKHLEEKTKEGSKTLLSITFILLSAICLFFSLFSLANLVKISFLALAQGLNLGVVILSLILVVLAITLSKKRALLKFSLIFFPFIVGLILLIFFFSFPFMSLKYLEIKDFPEISLVLKKTMERFMVGTLPVCVPLTALCFNKPSTVSLGGTIGTALVLLTVVNTILIFGSHFSAELAYPYTRAVSTVSLGELFSRMDAVLYPVCFFPGIIRVSAQLLAAVELYKKAKNIRKNIK